MMDQTGQDTTNGIQIQDTNLIENGTLLQVSASQECKENDKNGLVIKKLKTSPQPSVCDKVPNGDMLSSSDNTVTDIGDLPSSQDPPSLSNNVENGDLPSTHESSIKSSIKPEVKQSKTPFVWCRWIAKWPKSFFVLTLLGHLAFIAASIGLYFSGYNILAFVFEDLPLHQLNDIMHRRQLAWFYRQNALDDLTDQTEKHEIKRRSIATNENDTGTGKRYYGLTTLALIYDAKDENILTLKNLKRIQEYENHLFNLRSFQYDYCLNNKKRNAKCWRVHSLLNLFYDPDANNITIANITGVLAKAVAKPKLAEQLKWIASKDFSVNATQNIAFATKIRSEIYFGFDGRRDLFEALGDFESWALSYFLPYLEVSSREQLQPLTLYYGNTGHLYWAKIAHIIYGDLYLLIGSLIFIFIFTWLLTTSLWVTTWGIFSIVTSFVCANLIYNVGIGYKFFGIFNVLALYLVLGVGVDDLYVFFNTWKMLAREQNQLDQILDLTCRRAGFSMLITSVTTMAAFFVSSFSPILPISAFGTFAGLTILVNYISVMVFFPTVVAVYHVHFKVKNCLCCSLPCCERLQEPDFSSRYCDTSRNMTQSLKKDLGVQFGSTETGCAAIHRNVLHWFGEKYSRFVSHSIMRWVIIAAFGVLVGYMAYSLSNSELDGTDIQILKHDDPFEIARNMRLTAFHPNKHDNPRIVINLMWGLRPQDMSKCKFLEYEEHKPCTGHSVWDSQFDINLPENQIALLGFCEKLLNVTGEMKSKLKLVPDPKEPEKNQLVCIMKIFNDFLKAESLNACYQPNADLSLPITTSKLQMLIDCHQDIFLNISAAAIRRPFEVAIQYWLYIVHDSSGRSTLKDNLGFLATSSVLLTRPEAIGIKIVEAKIQFLLILVTTSGRSFTMPDDERIEMKNSWEEFLANEIATFPKSLQGGFLTVVGWSLLTTIQDIMHHAFTGLGIGTAISFVTVLMGTRNIIVSLLSLLTLGSIVICIVGIIPLAGWKLGILEGLNMCFVVGLAVDYTVHMAQAYSMSIYSQRSERIRDSLQHVAISILSGAATTLGASCFMFLCRVHFFLQFGIFIFATIGFSILFALVFFPALLSVLGPSGTFGNLLRPGGAKKSYVLKDVGRVNEAYIKTDDESRF
ncbi:protein dispatched homolog 1-like [Lineus longissimus]|uniref:protein dispatched homolog 1-like n=1 Tax=Lineus longissimus TaxID=88925 RepID=UPI00315CD773